MKDPKKSSRKRPSYSESFKADAVRMCVEGGVGPSQVARDLGVNVNSIRAWVKASAEGHTNESGASRDDRSEIARLHRELREVKMERDILRKAAAYFARANT